MEQYLDARVKRYVQRRLFSKIDKTKTILGLAGTHPEKYIEVLPYHKRLVLVDFKPSRSYVRRNSLVGEFDLLNAYAADYNPVTFVDCDFCKTIKSCGDDLMYIYKKMKRSTVRNKHIAFTFSVRNAGLSETISWLRQIEELHLPYNEPIISKKIQGTEIFDKFQFVKQFFTQSGKALDLYEYRDSGAIMISGLIKVA